MEQGCLTLKTGKVFEGIFIGANKESFLEIIFNTSMTGYQEIITESSHAGQIILVC